MPGRPFQGDRKKGSVKSAGLGHADWLKMKERTISLDSLHPKIKSKLRRVIEDLFAVDWDEPESVVVVPLFERAVSAPATGYLVHRDAFGEITVHAVRLEAAR